MPNLNLPAPIGWNEWDLNRNVIPVEGDNIIIPDIPMIPLYLPASAFWLRSLMDHCQIDFLIKDDTLTTFFLGGGVGGTLQGALGGLSVVELLSDLPSIIDLGIGRTTSQGTIGGLGPSTGFAIGDSFKHQAYIRLQSTALEGVLSLDTELPTVYYIELMQNYKYNKMYINHGEVARYRELNNEHILTLDIDQSSTSSNININGELLTIYKSDGTTVTVTILGVKENWDFIIGDPGDIIPSPGDFYQMNNVWSIEDPFLLSGFWTGPENDTSGPYSGLNLYTTTHTKPYKEGKFLGIYIYKDNDTVIPANSGISMGDVGDFHWEFYGLGNSQFSKVYDNDVRYQEVVLNGVTQYEVREQATLSDYNSWFEDDDIDYIRVELSNGAWADSHNWYAPCLKGAYLSSNGRLYKIVDHPEALIIDVAKESVDGSGVKFNPGVNQNYSILNQKGWIITEHYDGYLDGDKRGIYEGEITSSGVSSDGITTLTIEVEGDSFVSWASFNDKYEAPDMDINNFVSRYRQTHVHLNDEPTKQYDKNMNWKLIANNEQDTYSISDIVFIENNPSTFGEPYSIAVTLDKPVEGLYAFVPCKPSLDKPVEGLQGTNAYISFDIPYDTVTGSRKSSTIDITARPGIEGELPSFILANRICLDGEYFAPPYSVDLPLNTRLGCCDGYLFGLGSDGSAESPIGEWLYITTPRTARGIASLLHVMRDEDWVIFQDPVTKKMTIRRGCLDYKEYPRKTEIVIGESVAVENVYPSNNIINLNSARERLRRILVKVPLAIPNTTPNMNFIPSLLFGIGSENNIHGFVVSGDGVVDLQMLRMANYAPGSISSSNYTDSEDNIVSPVYIYKKGQNQHLKELSVDIAAKTSDGPIYINEGNVIDNVVVQYINDNQTLEDPGYFDVLKFADGEVIMLYGQKTSSFNLIDGENTYLNNSTSNNTLWTNQFAVMAIGSFNDSYYWGSPSMIKHSVSDAKPYSTMLLNSVEYLSSFYDDFTQSLNIFVRAFDGNEQYVGFLKISAKMLSRRLFQCDHPDYNSNEPQLTPLSFMYRPPFLPSSFVNDEDVSWTDNENIIQYGDVNNDFIGTVQDQYIRILGPTATGSQVTYGDEFGIISTTVLPDGTYMMFHDSNFGIRAIFSTNRGRTWQGSDLIYARDGRGGFLIDDYLFYITNSGIEVKFTNYADFSDDRTLSVKKVEGQDISVLEVNKQSDLDSMKHFLIGSGEIDFQRLSGYKIPDGMLKIFFYNKDDALVCMESPDSFQWKVADNF